MWKPDFKKRHEISMGTIWERGESWRVGGVREVMG
jgi:hypothetical protein